MPCQRTLDGFPTGGVHSVQNRSELGRTPARRGRPESESDTPVNIENGLYRDNGEGVAATPLPYPLKGIVPWPRRAKNETLV